MAIVSTSIGLEGLNGINNCIAAKDSAEEFAREVIDLYQNDNKILLQVNKNLNFVRNNFSEERAKKLFEMVFRRQEDML